MKVPGRKVASLRQLSTSWELTSFTCARVPHAYNYYRVPSSEIRVHLRVPSPPASACIYVGTSEIPLSAMCARLASAVGWRVGT